MAVAFVNSGSSGANTWAAGPFTVSTASISSVTAGNLLIAFALNITSTPSFSDNTGSGNVWTVVTTGGAGFNFGWTIAKGSVASPIIQVNYTSQGFAALIVRQYSGTDLFHPIDAVTAVASGSGTTASCNPITTNWNNEALIETMVSSSGGAVTPMAGFGNQVTAVANVATADQIVSTKQTGFVCTWTQASAAWSVNSLSIVAKGQRSPSGGNLGCSLLLGVG